MEQVQCSCCGVRGLGANVTRPKCGMCRTACDGVHGADLQRQIAHRVLMGKMSAWHGIAVSLLDDAWMSAMVKLEAAEGGANIIVPACPERWRVVIARAKARNEMPAIGDVLEAVLTRHFGRDNVQSVRDEIARDLTTALQALDPDVVDVTVKCGRSVLGPEEITIEVSQRTNVEPGARVMPGVETTEIPADIMLRGRAKA